jgi:hypothetical protein
MHFQKTSQPWKLKSAFFSAVWKKVITFAAKIDQEMD